MYKITTLLFCASLLMAQENLSTNQQLENQISHQKKMAELFLIEKKQYDQTAIKEAADAALNDQVLHQNKMAALFLIEKKKYDEKEAKAKKTQMSEKEKAQKEEKRQAWIKKKKAIDAKAKREKAQKALTSKQPVTKKDVKKVKKTGFDHLKSLGL